MSRPHARPWPLLSAASAIVLSCSIVLSWAIVLSCARPAAAELSEADFRKVASAAGKLMKQSGEAVDKQGAIAALGKDDSARALEILVRWAEVSAHLRTKRLEPEAEKLRAVHEAYRAKVLKKHKGSEAGWSVAERSRVLKRRRAWRAASALVVIEANLQERLAEAVGEAQSEGAVLWLSKDGVAALMRADGLEGVLGRAVRALLQSPPSIVANAVVSAVSRDLAPTLRIRVLDWIGAELVEGAAVRIAPCLTARSIPVRRAAVRTMQVLDDPHAVPSLIAALESATGLLAAEIEAELQRYTGATFSMDRSAWERWWKARGEAFLAQEGGKRHLPTARGGDVEFYGIVSPSDRIVFLLDRSGSMQYPAIKGAKEPVTGAGENGSAAGLTKLQVAKAELRRAINRLGTNVRFNVLFYNHRVDAWQAPPKLIQATRENKQSSRVWFMGKKPVGSTELFAGLAKALDYGQDFAKPATGDRGVDTIFLLSDGAPTTGMPAVLLTPAQTEKALAEFLAANGLLRCVVHTIGVGPDHNKELMKRLAKETGGTYVAVGMD